MLNSNISPYNLYMIFKIIWCITKALTPTKAIIVTELNQIHCEACRADAPQVSDSELKELISNIPDWNIETRNGIMQLEKEFSFKNFSQAILFTNKVGEIAEQEGHHPSLLTEWGKVTVTWWSHKIKGLHKNDFIMAAKTDLQLFE